MKKYCLLLIWFLGIQINAQELMRITTQDGTQYNFSVNNIQEMDFYTPEQINVVGEWIAISENTMICFELKNDGTLRRTSFFMTMGQYYQSEGTYILKDDVLTLNYDGSTLRIPIVEFTETKMVSTSGDVYYRVQETVYRITTNDSPIHIGNDGDVIKYVDNCIVGSDNNLIKPLRDGRGYAIVNDAETGELKAYGINVTFISDTPINWSQYFKKSSEQIKEEFGEKDQGNESNHTWTYRNYSASIQFVTFSFNDDYSEVTKVHLTFYDEEKRQNYCDFIEQNYVFNRTTSSGKIYYDTEDSNSASVQITVYDASVMCTIVYTDLKTTPASVVDWTQYFKKSGDQIKAEFGDNLSITDDDEDEDYSYLYSKNIGNLKRLTFYFTKGFEKVTSIRVTFNEASSMQDYCDAIAGKYILFSETETRKTYYDTDSSSTASVRVVIQSSGSMNYITYTDMSE